MSVLPCKKYSDLGNENIVAVERLNKDKLHLNVDLSILTSNLFKNLWPLTNEDIITNLNVK